MRLGSNAQRIYMLVGLKRLSTFTTVVVVSPTFTLAMVVHAAHTLLCGKGVA